MYTDRLDKIVSELKDELKIKRNKESVLTVKKEQLERQIEELNIDKLSKSLLLLQKLSQNQRKVACMRLEELGTKALQYSLGEEYSMVIELEDSRSRPQARLFIVNQKTKSKTDPLEENGGGVVDIISIALRMVILQAQQPGIDGPILLDEPFKMVSAEYIPMLVEFINKIREDFGRQIIMVTHNDFLAESCESVIRI